MSATISPPPVPRHSVGATFVVAMIVLGVVAAVQVFAVLWHALPSIQQQLKDRAIAAREAQAEPAAPVEPYRPVAPPAPSANAKQVEELFVEADRKYRLGDFENAMTTLRQLEVLSPGDPKVLVSKAQIFEKLNQPTEAAMALEDVLKIPGLPAEYRTQITEKLATLTESLALNPSQPGMGSTDELMGDGTTALRNETGIRPGATLGIVDTRFKDGRRGMKILSVAVKSLPGVEIVGDKVKILAYFYEKTEEGDNILTESKIISQWMSPPIDWAENEPELLDLQYILPDSSLPGSAASNGSPGREYGGYVVGLYYNGELQDFRSEPSQLARQFPLPLDDSQ